MNDFRLSFPVRAGKGADRGDSSFFTKPLEFVGLLRQAIRQIDGHLGRLDGRIDGLERRVDGLEARLDSRFNEFEAKLDAKLDARLSGVQADLSRQMLTTTLAGNSVLVALVFGITRLLG